MVKAGRTVHILSNCITSYDKKKLPCGNVAKVM